VQRTAFGSENCRCQAPLLLRHSVFVRARFRIELPGKCGKFSEQHSSCMPPDLVRHIARGRLRAALSFSSYLIFLIVVKTFGEPLHQASSMSFVRNSPSTPPQPSLGMPCSTPETNGINCRREVG